MSVFAQPLRTVECLMINSAGQILRKSSVDEKSLNRNKTNGCITNLRNFDESFSE
jgi:hypothetical protein